LNFRRRAPGFYIEGPLKIGNGQLVEFNPYSVLEKKDPAHYQTNGPDLLLDGQLVDCCKAPWIASTS